MVKNIIIGKDSNLSISLSCSLKDTYLISAREVLSGTSKLSEYANQPINVILNNFQPANQLNDLESPQRYIEAAIYSTSKVLEILKTHNFTVNRIIYTSSSSVYGENIFCSETDELKPKNLHAALKVANERLVEKFCQDNNILYTIVRIFNMYGRDDKFSVVSKIIHAYKNNAELPIVNQGNAIRDFIHIEDVTEIYLNLLGEGIRPSILNVGTGVGNSIRGIIVFLENNGIHVKTSNCTKTELKTSTANVELLSEYYALENVIDVKQYILEQLKSKT